MRAAILQPSYLPWPGHFFQILNCDVFVFLDDVQYTKNDWRNRNRIKTPTGYLWLTVPVLLKGRFGQTILEAQIDNRYNWRKKHYSSIKVNYSKAAFFKRYEMVLREAYARDWYRLVDLDTHLTIKISNLLGLKRSFVQSSALHVSGTKTERLINICKKLGATEYMAGEGSKGYMQEELFLEANIKVTYRDYKPMPYPQLYGDFVPYLSILDMLLNCAEESLCYLQQE